MSIIWVSLLHDLLHADPMTPTVLSRHPNVFFVAYVFGLHKERVITILSRRLPVFPDRAIRSHFVVRVALYNLHLFIR